MADTQQAIAQELGLSTEALGQPKPNFTLNELDIKSRERLSAKRFQRQGFPSDIYKVKGTLTATLAASSHKIQQSAPFEVYLGTNPEENQKKTSAQADGDAKNGPEIWFMISPDALTPPQ